MLKFPYCSRACLKKRDCRGAATSPESADPICSGNNITFFCPKTFMKGLYVLCLYRIHLLFLIFPYPAHPPRTPFLIPDFPTKSSAPWKQPAFASARLLIPEVFGAFRLHANRDTEKQPVTFRLLTVFFVSVFFYFFFRNPMDVLQISLSKIINMAGRIRITTTILMIAPRASSVQMDPIISTWE